MRPPRRLPLVLAFVLTALPPLAGCVSPAADEPVDARSPYVDQLHAEIRGLTEEEIRELREGAGMGLARPAELNGYPGPRHALDLADELGLTQEQRSRLQALFDAMQAEAQAVGEEILARHARLEESFRTRSATAEGAEGEVAALAQAYGRLRWIHLRTHLEADGILTHEQHARYAELRGYGSGHEGHSGHGSG